MQLALRTDLDVGASFPLGSLIQWYSSNVSGKMRARPGWKRFEVLGMCHMYVTCVLEVLRGRHVMLYWHKHWKRAMPTDANVLVPFSDNWRI